MLNHAKDWAANPPSEDEMDEMVANAEAASSFLKALAHEGRLMILCHLATGEKSVTELEQLLSSRQAAVSQQLARLRRDNLVETRRQGKMIIYRLGSGPASEPILEILRKFGLASD